MDILIYILAIILVMWSQAKVKGAYQKFSRMAANTRYTGADVARLILKRQGIYDVDVEIGQGVLSDHYDPKHKIVRLSPAVFNTNSIAAVSIAAHEVGHAIQHEQNYGFIALRNTLLPLAIISGHLGWTVVIIGLITSTSNAINPLFWLGIGMLSIIALFQTVTLPVEFDASKRALTLLVDEGILSNDEQSYAKQMLSAAAFTYIAALLASVLNIIRLIMLSGRRR